MAPRHPALSTPELAFIVGAPLLWGILLLFHPRPVGAQGAIDPVLLVVSWDDEIQAHGT